MELEKQLGVKEVIKFFASLNPVTICLHVHILSKTRARLLKNCSPIRIGGHWITLEDFFGKF